jgi:hypothetical protein
MLTKGGRTSYSSWQMQQYVLLHDGASSPAARRDRERTRATRREERAAISSSDAPLRAREGFSCCQQRECTVGIWVGATVGREGGAAAPRGPGLSARVPRAPEGELLTLAMARRVWSTCEALRAEAEVGQSTTQQSRDED